MKEKLYKSIKNKALYAKTKAKEQEDIENVLFNAPLEQGDIGNVVFNASLLNTSLKTAGMSSSMHNMLNSPTSPSDASPAMTRIATKSKDNVEQAIKKGHVSSRKKS